MALNFRCAGLSQNPRGPYADVVAAAEIRLHHAVNHKGRGHVDAVLAGILAVPFDLVLQLRAGKRRSQRNVAIAFDTLDNLLRRGVHVWPAAVVGKLKLFAVVGDGFKHLMRLLPAVRQGGSGENAAHDDAGKQMPGLGLETNFDRHVIRANFIQQIIQLIKGAHGERAGGFEEHLKGAWAMPQTSGWAVRCEGVLIVDSCFFISNNDITFARRRRLIFLKGTISESNEWYHHSTSVW